MSHYPFRGVRSRKLALVLLIVFVLGLLTPLHQPVLAAPSHHSNSIAATHPDTPRVAARVAAPQASLLDNYDLIRAITAASGQLARLSEQPLNPARRDTLLAVLDFLWQHLTQYPDLPGRNDLGDLIVKLRTSTNPIEISAALRKLSETLNKLLNEANRLERTYLYAKFTPGAAVASINRPVTTTLHLEHKGSEPITVTLALAPVPPGVTSPQTFRLLPDQERDLPITLTPKALGPATLAADVRVWDSAGLEVVQARQRLGFALTVVDQIAQITRVSLSPDYVETGPNGTDLSIHVANIANWRMSGQALVDVRDAKNQTVLKRTVSVSVVLNDAQNTFALGRLDTSGLAEGLYRVNVALAIDEPTSLSGSATATSFAFLSVGRWLNATATVEPALVAPGSSVVTTTISTQRIGDARRGATSGSGHASVIATQTITVSAPANLTSTWTSGPAVGLPLSLEPGTYDVVIAGGAIRRDASSAWYNTLHVNVKMPGVERDYPLGFGPDAHNGGSPTQAQAAALNQGKSVRVYLPQPAQLRFWAYSNDPSQASGFIQLRVNKVRPADTSLASQVEGALGWSLPSQLSKVLNRSTEDATARIWTDNTYVRCLACHVQAQALVSASDADSRMPDRLTDHQTVASLHSMLLGGVRPEGRVEFGRPAHEVEQTIFTFWSLLRAQPNDGVPPAPEPPLSGIRHYEENDPALRYNGLPYSGARAWMRDFYEASSGGGFTRAKLAGDTVSLAFQGSWVSLTLLGNPLTGLAEVLIDGQSYDLIDTYRSSDQWITRAYSLPSGGAHTLTVLVRGTTNRPWIRLDGIDVWDDTPMPQGTFGEDHPRVRGSTDWSRDNDKARGGSYWYGGSNAWFSFTGDSFTFQEGPSSIQRGFRVLVDGVTRLTVAPKTSSNRVWSLRNLGNGPHIVHIQTLAQTMTIDSFTTPALEPAPGAIDPTGQGEASEQLGDNSTPPPVDQPTPAMVAPGNQPDAPMERDVIQPPVSRTGTPKVHMALLGSELAQLTSTRTETEALTLMADYLLTKRYPDGAWRYELEVTQANAHAWWTNDTLSQRSSAMTAYVMEGLGRLYERTGEVRYRDALLKSAKTMRSWYASSSSMYSIFNGNISFAVHQLIGLSAALPYITDSAEATATETRMLQIAAYLRSTQHTDGGWGLIPGWDSDPFPTGGALYALALLQPPPSDPVLLKATRFLLRKQTHLDGLWQSAHSDKEYPIAATTWVNISLPWIYAVLTSYAVDVDHRVPLAVGFGAQPNSFAPIAGRTTRDRDTMAYGWSYAQPERQALRQMRFATRLDNLRPGEVRQVSSGTVISYTLESGTNQQTLPPLFVQAGHLIQLDPPKRVTSPGLPVDYTITLTNPGSQADTFTLSLTGLPETWASAPAPVVIPPAATRTLTLSVRPTFEVRAETRMFGVQVETGKGGRDAAVAELVIERPLSLALSPLLRQVNYGQPGNYTLSLTSRDSVTRTYTLDLPALPARLVSLIPSVTLAPGATLTTTLVITGSMARGLHPFMVRAVESSADGVRGGTTGAGLEVLNAPEVMALLSPASQQVESGRAARYQLTVTNTGELSDGYRFALELPPGWSYRIEQVGVPLDLLQLEPGESAPQLELVVVTPPGTAPQTRALALAVSSTIDPAVGALASAELVVIPPLPAPTPTPTPTVRPGVVFDQRDRSLCQAAPGWLTISGVVSVPLGNRALLQTSTSIVYPADLSTKPEYQYHGPLQNGDRFSVQVYWPGIRPSDTVVEIHIGGILLDPQTKNPIMGRGASLDYYWYPWVCAAPTAAPTATPTAIPSATPTAIPSATPTATATATPVETPQVAFVFKPKKGGMRLTPVQPRPWLKRR